MIKKLYFNKKVSKKLGRSFLLLVVLFVWSLTSLPRIPLIGFPPNIPFINGATVVKTWTFTGNAEGLADAANSTSVSFAHDATDNAVKFTTTTKNLSNEVEFGRKAATGETWETWGLPTNATVTDVQITAWQEELVANTKLTSHSLKARIIDSGGSTVHSAGDMLNVTLGTTIDPSYQAGAAGTSRAVDAGSQASSTDVRLELEYTVTTSGGGGTASVDQRFDTIELTITYTPPTPSLTQNDWRLYVDNDALDPTEPWGDPDLDENISLTSVPPSNDPVDPGDEIRIRISVNVSAATLTAANEGFILQYKETNTCTDGISWTDVDASGGSGTWRFASSSVGDNTALSGNPPTAGDLNLGVSDRAGRYSTSAPTSTNPFDVSSGEDFEWDWHIQYNGNAEAHSYCFRMIRDDTTTLNSYNSDSYPRVDARPSTPDFMQHGNFFSTGQERGYFWAD